MNLFLRFVALSGIGLQISIALASSACNSVHAKPFPPLSSRSPTFRSSSLAHFGGISLSNPKRDVRANRRPSGCSSNNSGGESIAAFASRQSYQYNRNRNDSQPRFVPQQYHCSTPCHPATRLFTLPEHYEPLTVIATLAFWPVIDALYDLATFMVGLTFMAAAASVLITKSEEEQREPSLVAMAAGGEINVTNNDEILTPADYADSRSAKRRVKDTIVTKASEAFDSTDFSHEPHLSPELEDAEAAYEVALLANAAHDLADAAAKENRQSKAAMLERQKELEWIEEHDREAMKVADLEVFQRSLLAEQLAIKSKENAKKREAFQRSLLSARIANDAKVKEAFVNQQLKEEWMGSEVRAASMGGPECLPFTVASAAASSAAAHALAEVEAEEHEEIVEDESHHSAPAAVASAVVADTAERMIMGEDIAFYDHSPEISAQFSNQGGEEEVEELPIEEIDPTQLLVQDEVLPDAEQWKNDYVSDVRNYVNQNAIQRTKERMSQKDSGTDNHATVDDVSAIQTDTSDANQSNEVVRDSSESESVIKRVPQRGIIRRLRQKKTLVVVALAVVLSRRLFLAYFGNALRLI